MEQVTEYKMLSRRVMAHMKPGMQSNNFLRKEDYLTEIARGSLYLQEGEDYLLLFRQREGFLLMNYMFCSPRFLSLPPGQAIVTEVPLPPGREPAPRVLLESGFQFLLRRFRFQREGAVPEVDAGLPRIVTAQPSQAEEIYGLLRESFPGYGGCLPAEQQLRREIDTGLVLTLPEGGAVLRYSCGEKESRLLQLAVAGTMRRRGCGRALVEEYLRRSAGRRCQVWTGEENLPARTLYEGCGFRPDGWQAVVLKKG